jgi:hypothetical protein
MDPVDVASLPPEYVNASNAGRIVGVVGAFHFLALAFVSLRIYVRVFMIRAFGIDDALIVVAYVSTLRTCVHANKKLTSLGTATAPCAHGMDLFGPSGTLWSGAPQCCGVGGG